MEIACHSLTLCLRGKSRIETADSAHCPLAPGQVALDPPKGVLPAQWPGPRPQTWNLCAAARVGNAQLERVCGISRDPGCGTLLLYGPANLGSEFRIMILTCGAKGTRTPDPLLANNRQHVHHRPYLQVTVPERLSASLQIRTCCGTFVLYSSPWVRGG